MIMDGSAGVTELAKGGNSTVLKVNGSGSLGYAKVDLTADVTGVSKSQWWYWYFSGVQTDKL